MGKGRKSPIGPKGPTEETQKRMDAVVGDVVQSLGLQEDVSRDAPKPGTGEKPSEATTDLLTVKEDEKPLEEVNEKVEDQVEEQIEEPKEEKAEEKEPPEEELIPKSKVDDRFAQMTSEIKSLKSQLEAKEKTPARPETNDEKLEKLSEQELKTLRRQIRKEFKTEPDAERMEQLLDLEEKVEELVQTAPLRFQKQQLSRLNDAIMEASAIDSNIASQKGELWDIAKAIYSESPVLQRHVEGQAEAVRLAAKHYSALKETSSGNQKVVDLKQQVNSLKKKTSLDGNTLKVNQRHISGQKLREKAMAGNMRDKQSFVRDVIMPQDFLED